VQHLLGREAELIAIAKRYHTKRNFLYLGRGINYPIALEGGPKGKGSSYIHAEGYAAGEMKHGPIALIDKDMPVVVLAPRDRLYEKTVSNLMEVKARGAPVIVFVTAGERELGRAADAVFTVPDVHPLLSPILFAVALQLLAYHIAVLRGHHMDQLKEVDTEGVEPTATVLPTENVFREDAVKPSLTQERALANAPDQADGFFRVPKILEDR